LEKKLKNGEKTKLRKIIKSEKGIKKWGKDKLRKI